jgi:integrase
MWRLKQGLVESTVIENIRKLKRISKYAGLENPEEVKKWVATGKWLKSYKESLVNAYATWCDFRNISFEKPKYHREENLPFIPLEKELDDLISGVNEKTGVFLTLLKETGVESGEAWKLRVKDLWIKQRTVNIRGTKRHKGRQLKISSRLVSMLTPFTKGKEMDERLFDGKIIHFRRWYELQRKKLAKKLKNPRLMEISFRTFRHWKATTEYHKTKDILHVKWLLGHHNIKNTLIYTHLINWENDEWVCKVANSLDEAVNLIESGFEYVTEMEGNKIFRKRK